MKLPYGIATARKLRVIRLLVSCCASRPRLLVVDHPYRIGTLERCKTCTVWFWGSVLHLNTKRINRAKN